MKRVRTWFHNHRTKVLRQARQHEGGESSDEADPGQDKSAVRGLLAQLRHNLSADQRAVLVEVYNSTPYVDRPWSWFSPPCIVSHLLVVMFYVLCVPGCSYISAARVKELSEELSLTERRVRIWFNNRRARYGVPAK